MRNRVSTKTTDPSGRRRFLGRAAAATGSVSLLAAVPAQAEVATGSAEVEAKPKGPDERYRPSAYTARYYELARG